MIIEKESGKREKMILVVSDVLWFFESFLYYDYRNIFRHFRTVVVHKWYVMMECFKNGLYWQGITHDLSKFQPVEFFESFKYYSGEHSPIDNAKDCKGYSDAWNHHKGRNKHHWQYWVDWKDGKVVCVNIPKKYLIEACCDIIGASKAYNGKAYKHNLPLLYFDNNSPYWIMTEDDKNFMKQQLIKMLKL